VGYATAWVSTVRGRRGFAVFVLQERRILRIVGRSNGLDLNSG